MGEIRTISARQVIERVKQQDFRCAISGRMLTPETASLDHILPLSRGGEHSFENVWVVDHQINIAKGTMTLEEFVNMCRQVTQYQDGRRNIATASSERRDAATDSMVP